MLLTTIVVRAPIYVSDKNGFLKVFLGNDLLSTLGFIVAVTLASIANLHLELNQLEFQTNNSFLRTRLGLRKSAMTLIVLFGFAIVLVTLKSSSAISEMSQAVFNCAGLTIVYINLEVLWDITSAIFKIPSIKSLKDSHDK